MHFSTLFFDLDATLYPASNGLWDQIRLRINHFMREKVGIPESDITRTRDRYWKDYGTTLEGLRAHHQINVDDYLDYVHDVPLSDYLNSDPQLREILSSLPQNLWVFTNADRRHAQKVLDILGLQGCFQGIIDLFTLNFSVKPRPESYQIALETAGEKDPKRCVLIDDMLQNLLPAQELGFTTVLVGEIGNFDGVDYHLGTIYEIREKVPQLWTQT
jgi:putative hydrolase of the HAD superfamily